MTTKPSSSIDADEARSALKIVQDSAQRGTRLYRYYQASPFFFLWALVWFLGFGLSEVFPGRVITQIMNVDLQSTVLLGFSEEGKRQGGEILREYGDQVEAHCPSRTALLGRQRRHACPRGCRPHSETRRS